MVKRSYDLVPTGTQRFEERFPGKRRRLLDDDIPAVSQWRCNLTGLSSTRNLYFVAYGNELHVFEPQFPSHALPNPVLIIPSSPSRDGLYGHLDEGKPASINNLLVTFLGSEEVIAVVRDDGDVDVFLLRHIVSVLQVRNGLSIVADGIRPFFQHNVGASAWGLSVHSQARVIAVSSNRHEITVFRFGVVSNDLTAQGTHDVFNRVINGDANIPCIAMCNTGEDPDARWLLTTDINGLCRLIDLRDMSATHSFRFGRQIENMYGSGFDRINAGWTVMFLSTRSFTPEDDFYDALGLQQTETLPDARDNPRIWDLSRTIRSLHNAAQVFIRHRPPDSKTRAEMTSMSVRQRQGTDYVVDNTQPSDAESHEEGEASYEPSVSESSTTESDEDGHSSMPYVVDDLADEEDEGTEDTIPQSAYYGGERICGNYPRFIKSASSSDTPCPILHCSVRNVYLLQPSRESDVLPQPPFVGFAAPLKQQIQLEYHGLNLFERLNMSAYIPTLGVVIVATQKGRVLVLALTKLSRSVRYPPELESLGSKTNYAMRVEAILPTASQEQQNLRPFAPLHGIAAGPMQGTEQMPDHKKRWRLMLMYQDHTLLSYEIVKKKHTEDVCLSMIV